MSGWVERRRQVVFPERGIRGQRDGCIPFRENLHGCDRSIQRLRRGQRTASVGVLAMAEIELRRIFLRPLGMEMLGVPVRMGVGGSIVVGMSQLEAFDGIELDRYVESAQLDAQKSHSHKRCRLPGGDPSSRQPSTLMQRFHR